MFYSMFCQVEKQKAAQLTAFFSNGAGLPGNPVMITFDDGYADFASLAAPILKEAGFTATVFWPLA